MYKIFTREGRMIKLDAAQVLYGNIVQCHTELQVSNILLNLTRLDNKLC